MRMERVEDRRYVALWPLDGRPCPPLLGLMFLMFILLLLPFASQAQLGFVTPGVMNDTAYTDLSGPTQFSTDGRVRVAADGRGHWVAVWTTLRKDSPELFLAPGDTGGEKPDEKSFTGYAVVYARSSNAGRSWSEPQTLINLSGAATANAAPDVAADGKGNWYIVYNASLDVAGLGTDDDLFLSKSTDNGLTWSVPMPLYDGAREDGDIDDSAPRIGTNRRGTWLVVWRHSKLLQFDFIYYSYSDDNGATWSTPARLNTNTEAGRDDNPVVTTDERGRWVVAWESNADLNGTTGTDGDILLARSTDNAHTWSAPFALSSGLIDGEDDIDRSPTIDTDGRGNWLCLWASNADLNGVGNDFDIMMSKSVDFGETWTDPRPVNDALNDETTVTVGDFNPWVATDRLGHWMAAWNTNSSFGGTLGTDHDIMVTLSRDFGETWVPAVPLNINAGEDSGQDTHPMLLADRQGEWIAAWSSTEDLRGEIGEDQDILVAFEMPPRVVGIFREGSLVPLDSVVTFRVLFNELVKAVSIEDFDVDIGNRYFPVAPIVLDTYSDNGEIEDILWYVDVDTGRGTGRLGIRVRDDATIVDTVGSFMRGGFSSGEKYLVKSGGNVPVSWWPFAIALAGAGALLLRPWRRR